MSQPLTCFHCGAKLTEDTMHELDDHLMCDDCFDELTTFCDCANSIHNYHYKPEPTFYGSGCSLFMGVELEIDEGGESDYNAEKICNIVNFDEEHIYCKHDGSLEDGFEIVSHPMTLDYHTNIMNWREIMTEAIRLRYTSHNAGSCGLHVHCNRDFFGDTMDEQEIAIGRIVFFVEKH